MSDKYPSLSPFAYCANNPVILTDPDGRDIWIQGEDGSSTKYIQGMKYDGNDKFTKKTIYALNKLSKTKTGGEAVNELVSSKNTFDIQKGEVSSFTPSNAFEAEGAFNIENAFQNGSIDELLNRGLCINGSGGTINWNPKGEILPTTAIYGKNQTTDLAHEMFHGLDANRGQYSETPVSNLSRNEWQACFRENNLRTELHIPLRTFYIPVYDTKGNFVGGSGTSLLRNGKSYIPFYY